MPSRWIRTRVVDPIMVDPCPGDIVIPIIGPTGSGKSTFINSLIGEPKVNVGNEELEVCTKQLSPVVIEGGANGHQLVPMGRRLIIVDTPGFVGDEMEILKRISDWLKMSYAKSNSTIKFAGIVFLYDCSVSRIAETIQSIAVVLKKLRGDVAPFVILGSTKWELVDKKTRRALTQNLREQYLKKMIDNNTQSWPIYNTRESAWMVVNKIISRYIMPPKKPSKKKQIYIDKIGPKLGDLINHGRDDDIIVPIMGPNGSGKSTFINSLFGDNVAKVGHELESCTSTLQPIVMTQEIFDFKFPHLNGRQLVIVDTPGFDDTVRSDSEILELISNWLALCYSKDMKLAGIIYLHDISQTRMTGATQRNLNVFKKLCGNHAFKLIVLGTTKWSLLEKHQEVAEERLQQLEEKFWSEMVDAGSRIVAVDGDPWKLVEDILNVNRSTGSLAMPDTIAIQRELVEYKKTIPETEAGMELKHAIDELIKIKKENQEVQKAEIMELLEAAKTLKVPFSRRITRAFGL